MKREHLTLNKGLQNELRTLDVGEPYFATDTNNLIIGTGTQNLALATSGVLPLDYNNRVTYLRDLPGPTIEVKLRYAVENNIPKVTLDPYAEYEIDAPLVATGIFIEGNHATIRITNAMGYVVLGSNSTIQNVTLVYDVESMDGAMCMVAVMPEASNLKIRNCTFMFEELPEELPYEFYVLVLQNIGMPGEPGMADVLPMQHIEISECTFSNIPGTAIFMFGTTHYLTVKRCTFTDVLRQALIMSVLYSSSNMDEIVAKHVRIEDNSVLRCGLDEEFFTQASFYIEEARHVSISGNVFKEIGVGIELVSIVGGVIQRNTFETGNMGVLCVDDVASDGQSVFPTDIIIQGNKFQEMNIGVLFDGGALSQVISDISILNNTFFDTVTPTYTQTDAENRGISFSHNTLTGCGMANVPQCAVQNNTFHITKLYMPDGSMQNLLPGAAFQATEDSTITHNFITYSINSLPPEFEGMESFFVAIITVHHHPIPPTPDNSPSIFRNTILGNNFIAFGIYDGFSEGPPTIIDANIILDYTVVDVYSDRNVET